VSAGSWFQIIEALRPKTADVLQALADLIASPYVRYRRTLSREAAQAVVARVRMHRDADVELATRIMMNSVFIQEIEDAEPDSADQIARIDHAIVSAAKQAQQDARAAQLEAEQERARVKAVEEEAASRIRDADLRRASELAQAEERRREAEENATARYEAEIRRLEREHHDELEQHDALLDAERRRAEISRRRLRTFVGFALVAVVAAIGLLAVGVDTFWAVALVVIGIVGFWAALDQLWINR
jgi:hypothetical protein